MSGEKGVFNCGYAENQSTSVDLEQTAAGYSLASKSGPLPVCVNKSLFEHISAHSLTFCL